MKHIFILLILLFILFSCEKDLKTEIIVTPKLCFNCVLDPDSLIIGSLSLSQSISENKIFIKINNAVIELTKDGQLFGLMKNSGDGIYSLEQKPITGSKYNIKIMAEGYPELSASTIVPAKPEISYQLGNPVTHGSGYNSFISYTIQKNIMDQVGKNRYWHYRLRSRQTPTNIWGFVGGFYDVDSPIIDDFNRVSDATDDLGFHYEYYLRINDIGMDGETLTFNGTSYNNEINFFMDTDVHYDKYLKSTIKQKMNDGDNLLFNEPVQIYSNIENGLGIFGSVAITSFKL
ncbi:MAG: DUF4249 domain-containing protein [Bacteroidota bacterium]|nr:DUF4249 domain-containing protein [Bacteroidota bacterium]